MQTQTQFEIRFIPSGRGKARCKPDPRWPKGLDIDVGARPACKAVLPYPAKECGLYMIKCALCETCAMCTAAGRADDPRSMMVPCQQAQEIEVKI